MTALSAYVLGPTGFTKARRPGIEDALRAVADKQQPKIRKAILAALKAADSATIKSLAEAIQAGQVGTVLALLGLDKLEARFGGLVSELRSTVAQAGGVAAASAPPIRPAVGPKLDVTFDLYNPRTLQFLQEYEFRLIREISENTRAGIRSAVSEGITQGRNPRAVARELKKSVGLTERQMKMVSNFRKELETFHLKRAARAWNLGGTKSKAPGGAGTFAIDAEGNPIDGILHRRLRDFRYDKQLIKAMQSGKPLTPDQIEKMVGRYRERMIAYRAENIAKTESLRAMGVGNHQAWVQAQEQGLGPVVKEWRTAGDERVRLDHRRIPKLNPDGVPVDQPFKTPSGPVMHPPLGVNCRCVAVYRVRE
jgi:hypothetical protein